MYFLNSCDESLLIIVSSIIVTTMPKRPVVFIFINEKKTNKMLKKFDRTLSFIIKNKKIGCYLSNIIKINVHCELKSRFKKKIRTAPPLQSATLRHWQAGGGCLAAKKIRPAKLMHYSDREISRTYYI